MVEPIKIEDKKVYVLNQKLLPEINGLKLKASKMDLMQ